MKKVLLTILLFTLCGFTFAQQDPQFSQYNFNKLAFNPAYAGIRKAICFNGLFREQWTGFPGNPRNFLFSGDMYIPSIGGVGLTFINDELGFEKTNIAKVSYSFPIPLGVGTLAFGAEAGMVQKYLGKDWVYIDPNDPHIPLNGAKNTIWDMGVGIYYEVERGLFFGLSTLHIPQNDFNVKGGSYKFYESAIHYYMTAGWEFYLPSYDISVKPSLLAKTDAASTQIDFNVIGLWQSRIWAGGSYRLTDAFIVMAGLQQGIGDNTLKLGYSYDITTSALKQYSTGSHELFVSYCIPVPDKPKITIWDNVRYMHGGRVD